MKYNSLESIEVMINDITKTNANTKEENAKYLKQYKESNNTEIRDQLIINNSKLMLKIINMIIDRQNDWNKNYKADLIQIGYLSIMNAIEHFNINYDISLSTYLFNAIRNNSYKELHNIISSVKYPYNLQSLFLKYITYLEKYYEVHDHYPQNEEIKNFLQCTNKTLELLVQKNNLNNTINYYELENDYDDFDKIFENDLKRELKEYLLKNLDKKYYQILLLKLNDYTNKEIATILNLTTAQVCGREKTAYTKLRKRKDFYDKFIDYIR